MNLIYDLHILIRQSHLIVCFLPAPDYSIISYILIKMPHAFLQHSIFTKKNFDFRKPNYFNDKFDLQ